MKPDVLSLAMTISLLCLSGCGGDNQKQTRVEEKPVADESFTSIFEQIDAEKKGEDREPPVRPRTYRRCIILGEKALKRDDVGAALAYARFALEKNPRSGRAYYIRGRALYKAENNSLEKAIADLEKAVSLDPGISQANEILAETYATRGESEKAIEAASRAIKAKPTDAALYELRASILWERGRKEEALADLGESVKLRHDFRGYLARAKYFESDGRRDLAIKDYTTALEREKTFDLGKAEILKARAACYSRDNKHQQAIADLSQVVEHISEDDDAFRLRGEEYFKLKDYHRAVSDFTRAIEISPDYARASLEDRGRAYRALGENELAEKDLAEARDQEGKQAEKPVFEIKK
ncbi:MAG: tetratricopeptide repeat protein [Cyanobacteria bacterium HKST-UBA02]|nr:tetratricopeptide repeat protein [Cyanobacteria bacterium HKST-UBA02]